MFKALTNVARHALRNLLSYFLHFGGPTGKISDRSMMIVYRPIEVMDLILELDGMRSYTRNVDLDSAASCKYPAIRQPSHQHHFLE